MNALSESCIKSFLGPNKCCKFIESNGEAFIAGCLNSYLNSVELNSVGSLVSSCFKSYHKKYGCGSATMFTMFHYWYRALRNNVSAVNVEDLMEELENSLKAVIKSLSGIVYSCEKTQSSELATQNEGHAEVLSFVRMSKYSYNSCDREATSRFHTFKKNVPNLVKGIVHGNDLFTELIIEAWMHQLNSELQYSITFDLSCIFSTTITASSSNSCVVPGLLLKVKNDSCDIISHGRKKRALLINGSITRKFTHKGVNLTSKFNDIHQNDLTPANEIDIWISEILGVIDKLQVNLLLSSEKIDETLTLILHQSKVAIIENIRAKDLEIITNELGGSVTTYVTDCDEGNVVEVCVDIDESLPQICQRSSFECWVRLSLPKSVQTIIICHSVPAFSAHLEHSLWHQLHRLSNITKSGQILPGGCQTEHFILNHLKYLQPSSGTVSFLANEILSEGFNEFIRVVKENISTGETEVLVHDDYISKVNGWTSALKLACLITQMDYNIMAADFNETKHFTENQLIDGL